MKKQMVQEKENHQSQTQQQVDKQEQQKQEQLKLMLPSFSSFHRLLQRLRLHQLHHGEVFLEQQQLVLPQEWRVLVVCPWAATLRPFSFRLGLGREEKKR